MMRGRVPSSLAAPVGSFDKGNNGISSFGGSSFGTNNNASGARSSKQSRGIWSSNRSKRLR